MPGANPLGHEHTGILPPVGQGRIAADGTICLRQDAALAPPWLSPWLSRNPGSSPGSRPAGEVRAKRNAGALDDRGAPPSGVGSPLITTHSARELGAGSRSSIARSLKRADGAIHAFPLTPRWRHLILTTIPARASRRAFFWKSANADLGFPLGFLLSPACSLAIISVCCLQAFSRNGNVRLS